MLDIGDFNQVFRFSPKYAYSETTYNDILHNRRILHNQLFFDRLLAVLQIKGSQNYPPRTNQDLRQLHQRIVSTPIADHHKQSVLFYILRDCRVPGEAEPAEDFATACHLPQKYSICVQGLWEMDRLQFRPALESLTQPSLLPTFSPEILSVLLTHATSSSSSSDSELLPLAYYHTASPPLADPALHAAFFSYLCRISLHAALGFVRTQPAHQHRPLLEALISAALGGSGSGKERAERGVEIVEMPLDAEEEQWLEEYLLEGKGRNLAGAEETVVLRKIAMGRVAEVVRERGPVGKVGVGRRVNGVSWEGLRDGLERGVGARRDVPVFEM